MRFNEAYTAKAMGIRLTEDISNDMGYVGAAFFPLQRKQGVDITMIKSHKGVGVALKPSTYDALATIRPRNGFQKTNQEMPLFRESMMISEKDELEIERAKAANDEYLAEVIDRLYDDTAELTEGARISLERMRMNLLCPVGGDVKISIGLADNTAYTYDYDEDKAWKSTHYLALEDDATWDNSDSASPLEDIEHAINVLAANGVQAKYILTNSTTFAHLVKADEIKNLIVTRAGTAVARISRKAAKEAIESETNLTFIIYDKTFKESVDATSVTKFYADDYVTIIGEGTLGKSWAGVTPEERSLKANGNYDVFVAEDGVAIATVEDYGPPVQHSTTASMVALPSFEGMDSVFVIKVK